MFEELMAGLARALDTAALPYMVIGGQAVLLHGAVRVTDDVDLTLGVEFRVNDPERFVEQTMILPAFHREFGMRVNFAF